MLAFRVVTVAAIVALALPVAAQTDAEIEAQPLVKLQPGEDAKCIDGDVSAHSHTLSAASHSVSLT